MEKKQCPHCGEEIMKSAIKCKHCYEWLNSKGRDALSSKGEAHLSNGTTSRFPTRTWLIVRSFIILSFIAVLYIPISGIFDGAEYNAIEFILLLDFGSDIVLYFLAGIMFFLLRYYVQSVSNKNGISFTILSLLYLFNSILTVLLLYGYDGDEFPYEWILLLIICVSSVVVAIFCCSILFRLAETGERGTRSLGTWMLINIGLDLFGLLFIFFIDETVETVISLIGVITMICLIVQMKNIFNRVSRR